MRKTTLVMVKCAPEFQSKLNVFLARVSFEFHDCDGVHDGQLALSNFPRLMSAAAKFMNEQTAHFLLRWLVQCAQCIYNEDFNLFFVNHWNRLMPFQR